MSEEDTWLRFDFLRETPSIIPGLNHTQVFKDTMSTFTDIWNIMITLQYFCEDKHVSYGKGKSDQYPTRPGTGSHRLASGWGVVRGKSLKGLAIDVSGSQQWVTLGGADTNIGLQYMPGAAVRSAEIHKINVDNWSTCVTHCGILEWGCRFFFFLQ